MEIGLLILGVINLLGLAFIASRQQKADLDTPLHQEFAQSRKEFTEANKDLRIEVTKGITETRESLDKRLEQMRDKNDEKLEQIRKTVETKLESLQKKGFRNHR